MSEVPSYLANLAPWPDVDFTEFGEVEAKPRSRIQDLTGRFLGRNWVAIPHVTHHDEIDVTTLEARRRNWNAENPQSKLTPVALLVKAMATVLAEFPQFNASLDASGKALVYKKFFNIGVAVDTPNGLLVPVLRGVDKRSASELSTDLAAISSKARAKGLSMAEMAGGSMTLTSLGHIGGTAFTPIVNAPEVAILGVTKLQLRPMPDAAGGIAWRQMLPLSLSYDHRVINGADAARFVVAIGKALDNIEIN